MLVVAGGGADEYYLSELFLEFLEKQGSVIKGGGQTEAVFNEILLSGVVAARHSAHLRDSHVGLVDKHNKIVGHIVEERIGGGACGSARQHSRIVLHARAEAHLAEHLDIVLGSLLYSLRLDELVLRFEEFHALEHLLLYLHQRRLALVVRNGVVGRGEYDGIGKMLGDRTRQGIHSADTVNLVTEEFYTDGGITV